MKIQMKTDSYNERRYGRPWIASVSFSSASKADFKFGEWCGEHGYKGLLDIDVEPGSIIAIGQKDFRKPVNSTPQYWVVPMSIQTMPESNHTSDLEEAGFKLINKSDAYLLLSDNEKPKTSVPSLPAADESLLSDIREDLACIESESDAGRALSKDVIDMRARMKANMKLAGIEYNTPNLILLGSNRYKKYAGNYGIKVE